MRQEIGPAEQGRGTWSASRSENAVFDFFLIVTPGLEEIAAWELGQWHPELKPQLERGGLSLRLGLAEGLSLNHKLKVPTRILLRLAEFGCRDFPKLFRKISGFPWEEWVSEPLEFNASSRGSRLRIKKRIEECCYDGLQARFKKIGRPLSKAQKPEEPLSAFARLEDDVCLLSLDTSGVLLHKRGYRDFNSEAPIRETMAAALLLMMEKAASELKLEAPVELLDPMCGGGTFLLEGAQLATALSKREFGFQRFVDPPRLDSPDRKIDLKVDWKRRERIFGSFVGIEKDPDVCAAARRNLAKIENGVVILNQDLQESTPLPSGVRRWVVTNPPYGERLKIEGPLHKYYEALFETVDRVAQPELAAFVLPEKIHLERLKKPRRWRVYSRVRFSNGGLPVEAHVFHRS